MKLLKCFKWYDYLTILFVWALIVFRVYYEMELIDQMATLVEKVQYSRPVSDIWETGKEMIITSCIIFVSISIANTFASILSTKYAERLRYSIFTKVNSFSQTEINRFSIASLITRSTNDVAQVQNTLQMALRMIVMAPAMATFSIVRIVNSSIELTWATAGSVGVMFAMFILIFVLIVPVFGKMQKGNDRINLLARENLTGIRVIRAYNTEKVQEEKFDKENKKLTKLYIYIGKVVSLLSPGMTIIINGLTLVIIWLGAKLIGDGALVYKNLVAFQQYGLHILMSFMFLSGLIVMLPRGIVSLKRIGEVLKTKNVICEGNFDGETKECGTVEFHNVSFRYPNAEMNTIEDVSFNVKKGETVAIIGSTGSGKSTLINLIPRFYDASFGDITVDGINVKDYKQKALNKKIGFVPQKGVLFKGTILENIKYGAQDISEEKVWECLKVAQADFVNELDGKLDYMISQGGSNVSGGQRQRLCIARAIAVDPEIYIFDDSFSALDYKTDKALRAALNEYTKDATKIIVAQRVGTIMDADKIIVLDTGKIVGEGTHKELFENCEVYREIALSQLSEEEMKNGK